MGKLKLATDLLKLNNKLGLLDLGDLVGLASTAYKVKTFDPMDHMPDFDFFVDEEMERAERRKTLLLAGAAAGVAYLAYKNKDAILEALDNSESNVKALAKDAKAKGEEVVEKGKDLAEDAVDKGKDLADEVKDKGEDLAKDAAKKGKEVADDVSDKLDEVSDSNDAKEAIEATEVKDNFLNK